jgi:hypothetical protein
MVELVADLIKEGADVNDKNHVSLKCARNCARLCCCAGAAACGEVERGMEMGRRCMHALATHPLTPLPASARQNPPRIRQERRGQDSAARGWEWHGRAGRISGDFLRLLYILAHRQAANFFTRMGIPDPSSKAYKQRRGTYFYYNRAAIGLACAQATAMRIDIAPHKRPRRKQTRHVPDPHYFHLPPHARLQH